MVRKIKVKDISKWMQDNQETELDLEDADLILNNALINLTRQIGRLANNG